MKTARFIARLFLAVTILFSLSASILVSLLISTVSADESSCDLREDGSCRPKSSVDEAGKKTLQFLQEKVFGQKQADAHESGFLTLVAGGVNQHVEEEEKENIFFKLFDRLADSGLKEADAKTKVPQPNDMLTSLLERATIINQEEQAIVGLDFLSMMKDVFGDVVKQIKNTFKELPFEVDPSLPVAMVYYLTQVDALKNPSWKRRQHRFYEKVTKPLVLELHDALYLSQLSYVDKLEDFREGLAKFQNNVWELGYGTTESLPHMPAHFLLIHKHLGPLKNQKMEPFLPWETKKGSEIEVTLVVRGTKHLSDALADALLEPVEYRGGYAHGGILASGKALAETYLPKLKELLKYSGRDKVRLYLVGHSIGAAAASIAAMEFNDHDFIEVEAVGFGCPSLLSHELSESAKDYITTVVADADIIPRMSGSSMVNMLLELLEYDWTDSALEDIEYSLERSREVLSFGQFLPQKDTVMKWSEDFLNNEIRPRFRKEKRDRLPSVLIPPGNCIHFFRDGVGFSGTYTPCNFFSSIDLARTLVDDHLIMPGYHRALVSIVRDWEQDYNFDFVHDIASIPV